jgi:hypothetical protein
MMHVLICDDRKAECQDALDAARAGAPRGVKCESLHTGELTDALEKFFGAVRKFLDRNAAGEVLVKSPFDGHDIIILDNNLTHLKIEGAPLTAEEVAGYIRAFTTTPYVVSLNKNHLVDFDLQYLIGDNTTRADLAINTPHLRNRALWTGRSTGAADHFRPWYWPALVSAPARRQKQTAFVQARLKKSILRSLKFPDTAIAALSRHAKGWLSPDAQYAVGETKVAKPLTDVTFENLFLSSSRSLPADEDRKNLLKRKNYKIMARVIASELDIWFRRAVLGPQDVIVDVPHLLVRMPFLLGKRASDLRTWNSAIAAGNPPFGLEPSLYKRYLSPERLTQNLWIPTPAFWGQSLKGNERLSGLFFKSQNNEWGDFVFCEDTSDFRRRTSDDSFAPKEFVAEFETPWDRRYISGVKSKHYAPRSRLAL